MITLFRNRSYDKRDFKFSLALLIFSFVICFGFLIYLGLRYGHEVNDKHTAERIQTKISEYQVKLKDLFTKVSEDPAAYFNSPDALQRFKNKHAIDLFLFEKNKIKYWTTNLISVERYLTEIYNSRIVKLNNGWFLAATLDIDTYSLIGLVPIKSGYTYHNDLLPESFNKEFKIANYYNIQLIEAEHNIYSTENQFLFSISRIGEKKISDRQTYILFFIYHLVILLLLAIIKRVYDYFSGIFQNRLLLSVLLVVDVLILLLLIQYLRIPNLLYDSFIYSSDLYFGRFFNSLGDYFTCSIFLLFIIHVLRKEVYNVIKKSSVLRYISLTLLFVVLGITFILFEDTIISLFKNTQFSIQFGEQFIESPGISILIFTILSIISLSLYYLSQISVNQLNRVGFKIRAERVLILVYVILFGAVLYFLSNYFLYTLGFFILILVIVKFTNTEKYNAIQLVVFLLLFSAYMSFLSTFVLQEKELKERKELATKLAGLPDPIAEYDFLEIEKAIYKDDTIPTTLSLNNISESETILLPLFKKYFSRTSWKKYTPYLTICDTARMLFIQPENYEINGNKYFFGFKDKEGKSCKDYSLIHMQNSNLNNSYLARFKFDLDNDNKTDINIFVELVSEFIPEGIGYTELFADESQEVKGKDIINYSFIRYENDRFSYKFGSFQYSLSFNQFSDLYKKGNNFTYNGYNHLVYNVDKNTKLVISRSENRFWERIAPFSYFFILLLSFLLCYILIVNLSVKVFKSPISFKQRVQFSLTGVIFFSFLVIGTITIFYILDLNSKKNKEILSEKAHSVLVELEHKLSKEENSINDTEYLNQILNKFSLVFFSDINLFNLEGHKMASSRNRIFDEGLISPLMNPTAYRELTESKDLLFIQDESIGNYRYLSAYIPFRNKANEVIAYLNLPYFARQSEIQKEVSTFLVALVNIYLLFFVIGIIITLLISRNISKPLELIKTRMGQLKLGKSNEKISWNKEDEIGSLVAEYNRMIDELGHSANLLAKSERESAWREMAKQVAHEIKNPLTPMKLSVQFLKKAWEDNIPDWERRLDRFSTTIIDQIDTLSEIASAFSDFAKMPKQKSEKIELNDKIRKAVGLFKEHENIIFSFESNIDPCYIEADKNQVLRIFNNLIKNSIQAIGKKKDGRIQIKLKTESEKILVSLSDNGIGIPKDRADKIFIPSFTTKTSGMGLGLSIVRSIVIETGGRIWFQSEVNKGTCFYIELPLSQA